MSTVRSFAMASSTWSTKLPEDRALLNGQLAIVPVTSREKLAIESISSRTQGDEEEHRAQLHHDLVDALSTKLPADRALLNCQLAVVPVPSREQLAVESFPSRTQRDEAEHRFQRSHDLVDALSTKSPADQALLNNQLEVVRVWSREQLSVGSISSRT